MNKPLNSPTATRLYAAAALAVGAVGAAFGISAMVAASEVTKVKPIHQHGGAGFSLNFPVAVYSLGGLFFSFLAFLLFSCSRPIKNKRMSSPVAVSTMVLLAPATYIVVSILARIIF